MPAASLTLEKKQAENSLLKKRMIPQVEYVQTYSGRVLAVENPLYRQANQSFINHLDNAKYYKEQAAQKRENRLDVLDEVSDDFALVDDKRAKAARIEKDAIARANARSYQQKHSHGGKRYTTTDPWPTTQAHIPPVTHTASLPVYSTTPLDNNGGPTIPTQPTSMPYRTKQYTEYYQNPTPLRTRATYPLPVTDSQRAGLTEANRVLQWQWHASQEVDPTTYVDQLSRQKTNTKRQHWWSWR